MHILKLNISSDSPNPQQFRFKTTWYYHSNLAFSIQAFSVYIFFFSSLTTNLINSHSAKKVLRPSWKHLIPLRCMLETLLEGFLLFFFFFNIKTRKGFAPLHWACREAYWRPLLPHPLHTHTHTRWAEGVGLGWWGNGLVCPGSDSSPKTQGETGASETTRGTCPPHPSLNPTFSSGVHTHVIAQAV